MTGVPAKPPQGNFYAVGATKEEVEKWLAALSPAERDRATGFFTTIRRGTDGRLQAVPYSLEYQGELARVAALLREAAALTTQPTLKAYLETRAAALSSNDYYASDIAWMELDASIEPTIGPYETYEDEWFNYKAAFEAFITLRDDAETQKLSRLGAELQGIENNLPIDPKYRQPEAGRAGADPRRQHRVLVGRRQPRRADGGLQPAERRAGGHGQGLQARDAQEQPGGQVPHGAAADRQGGALGRRSGQGDASTRSSRTS